MQIIRLTLWVLCGAAAIACAGSSTPIIDAPATSLGAMTVSGFYPRQPLVIDAPAADVGGDTLVTVRSPSDVEHVVLRPYPASCNSGCALIDFMWNDGGSWVFFPNSGMAQRWGATTAGGPDERRGILYVPLTNALAARDTAANYTMFATLATITGHAGRLHAVLHTTDAFRPGETPSDQPPVPGDGVLHAHVGDVVTVSGAHGSVGFVVGAPPSSPPTDVGDGAVRTNAASYALRVGTQSIDVDIPVTYTNRTGHTVYRGLCGPLVPEKWTIDGWRGAYGVVCALVGGLKPDSILAGATRVDTLHIQSWRLPRSYPRFAYEPIPGTYRVDYGLSDATTGKPLPERERVSNLFQLVLP